MQRQQSNNASTDKAMGSLLVNQLLVGNSKNIFVVILTSLLSVYVTQYTTRKINSFRKLMKENPLFLVWGMLNLLTGKPFFNDRKSIQDNNIQPEKKEEELIVDENEIDEDIYYIKLHQQRNRKDTALPLNLENIGGMAVNAANVFTRVKRYITAEDILQQNMMMNQQQASQDVEFSDYFVDGSNTRTPNFSNIKMPNIGSSSGETVLPKI